MSTQIDHVIAVVDDLDAAAARMGDRHGLAAIPGGRHPGHGTGNRIVPLGSSYLELMAVVDPDEAAGSPMGRWAADRASSELTAAAVCFRTDSIDALATRLDTEPLAMTRLTADGTTLAWRLVGLDAMFEHGHPFFIEWETTAHPGRSEAPHRVEPRGLTRVGIPDAPDAVRPFLADVAGVELGTPTLTATIDTASGPVNL